MVPRILTDDQKQHPFHVSYDILYNAEMFDRVITGDEMWHFQYDSQTKCQTMQQKTQNSPGMKKACISRLYVSSVTSG
jgi:hypothetical protein